MTPTNYTPAMIWDLVRTNTDPKRPENWAGSRNLSDAADAAQIREFDLSEEVK